MLNGAQVCNERDAIVTRVSLLRVRKSPFLFAGEVCRCPRKSLDLILMKSHDFVADYRGRERIGHPDRVFEQACPLT